jgi:hypothetical protein
MKKNFIIILTLLSAALFCTMLISNGCSRENREGFAIYLSKEDIPPAQMESLSQIVIANQPIISTQDIVTYNAQTHELKLTAEAFERISSLEVPVRGKSFAVCVDKAPVYWGAFWTPISSISFGGVTIWKPLNYQEVKVITFELGYPSQSFYGGEDPRNKAELINSLDKAGKLINNLTIAAIEKLPHSMKGYELYSWPEDTQWHFTLITGTNRNKTLEEITSKEDFVSETGWIKIHSAGVDDLKHVLSKIPQGEFIMWLGGVREQSASEDIKLQLPPEPIINLIKGQAVLYGSNLSVASGK